MPSPLVSVVVCTYNRAEMLRDTLASLAVLETACEFEYEIVVVDNASTDHTQPVLREVSADFPVPLRTCYVGTPGVAAARNQGIVEARGEWIAFFDDDQLAHPRWLRELLAMARRKGCRCVGGVNRLRLPSNLDPEQLAPAVRALHGESLGRDREQRYSRKSSPGCGNLLLHRGVFDEVGVFDESLREAGEDTDLYRRIYARGIEAWCTPLAISYHVIPAYRLEEEYLRWKSLRNGSHLARRNRNDWGLWISSAVLLARMVQGGLVHLPRLWWAGWKQSPHELTGCRCRLWKTEGYVRFALRELFPRLFAQKVFFDRLEFRNERELLTAPAPTISQPLVPKADQIPCESP